MVPAFPNEKKKLWWPRPPIRFNTNCCLVLPHNEVNAFIAMKNSCLKVSKFQKYFFLKLHCLKKEQNMRQKVGQSNILFFFWNIEPGKIAFEIY